LVYNKNIYVSLFLLEKQRMEDNVQELLPSDFGRAKPLFHHIRDMRAAVFTVLEGNQIGHVWVDQVPNPRAAVMISDFCYLTSTPDASDLQADTAKWLEDEVLHRQEYTPIFYFSRPWEAALQTILPAYGVQRYVRNVFDFDVQRYRELQTGWQKRIPTGFALHRLNVQTAPDAGGIPYIWGSVENFMEHGFGFCMLDESQSDEHLAFAASVQTVFVGDCHAETGVETREAYRRKGLATALCCAYIDLCLQSGIYPEWGCGDDNKPSERLACKLGYTNKHETSFLYVHTPEHLREK
jgi:GNAT superfamily N-acetyltransferase